MNNPKINFSLDYFEYRRESVYELTLPTRKDLCRTLKRWQNVAKAKIPDEVRKIELNKTKKRVRDLVVHLAKSQGNRISTKALETMWSWFERIDYNSYHPSFYKLKESPQLRACVIVVWVEFLHTLAMHRGTYGKSWVETMLNGYDKDYSSYSKTWIIDDKLGAKNLYSTNNFLHVLQDVGILEYCNRYHNFSNGKKGLCNGYKIVDVEAFDSLLSSEDAVTLPSAGKFTKNLIAEIQHMRIPELFIIASACSVTLPKSLGEKAQTRRHLQTEINRLYHSGKISEEMWETKVEEADKVMAISQASIINRIVTFDIRYFLHIHTDNYGGRRYHIYTNLKSDYREQIQFIDEEMETVSPFCEVDMSEASCYSLYQLCLRDLNHDPTGENLNWLGNPYFSRSLTEALMQAVRSGKAREFWATQIQGQWEGDVSGKHWVIDFDKIDSIPKAEGCREAIKAFMQKAINCKQGTREGQMLQKALDNIDPSFSYYLQMLRKGRWLDTEYIGNVSTKSLAPYKAIQFEVDLFFGQRIDHPDLESKLFADTEIRELDSVIIDTSTGVIENAINNGVGFILSIHDALIVTSDQQENVFFSFTQASCFNRHCQFAPHTKTKIFATGEKIKRAGMFFPTLIGLRAKHKFEFDTGKIKYSNSIERFLRDCVILAKKGIKPSIMKARLEDIAYFMNLANYPMGRIQKICELLKLNIKYQDDVLTDVALDLDSAFYSEFSEKVIPLISSKIGFPVCRVEQMDCLLFPVRYNYQNFYDYCCNHKNVGWDKEHSDYIADVLEFCEDPDKITDSYCKELERNFF